MGRAQYICGGRPNWLSVLFGDLYLRDDVPKPFFATFLHIRYLFTKIGPIQTYFIYISSFICTLKTPPQKCYLQPFDISDIHFPKNLLNILSVALKICNTELTISAKFLFAIFWTHLWPKICWQLLLSGREIFGRWWITIFKWFFAGELYFHE